MTLALNALAIAPLEMQPTIKTTAAVPPIGAPPATVPADTVALSQKSTATQTKAATAKRMFSEVPGYTGPADGLSHPRFRNIILPLAKALVSTKYRVQVQGAEYLERPGPQMFCPTHPTIVDPALAVTLLGHRDVRTMANSQMFRSVMGPVFTWVGAFPVNREGGSLTTMRHCNEMLHEGKSLCVFPEGTVTGNTQVGPLQKGAQSLALTGGAETITCMATAYHKDTESRPVEAVMEGLAATAVLGGGIVAALCGGPVARLASSTIGAALAGGLLVRNVARHFVPRGEFYMQDVPRWLAGLAGAAAGALVFGTTAGVSSWVSPLYARAITLGAGLAGGLATLGWAQIFRHRDIAEVKVCPPILLQPYRDKYMVDGGKGTREATHVLTEEVHRTLGHAREALTGIPYDENAPKFGGRVVETLKGHKLLESESTAPEHPAHG